MRLSCPSKKLGLLAGLLFAGIAGVAIFVAWQVSTFAQCAGHMKAALEASQRKDVAGQERELLAALPLTDNDLCRGFRLTVMRGLVFSYLGEGRYADAKKLLDETVAFDTKLNGHASAETLRAEADWYRRQADYKRAFEYYTTAHNLLDGDEARCRSLNNLGIVAIYSRDEKKAQDLFQEAADRESAQHLGSSVTDETKLCRAELLFDLGKVDEAAKIYSEVLNGTPDRPAKMFSSNGLGKVALSKGDLKNARKYLDVSWQMCQDETHADSAHTGQFRIVCDYASLCIAEGKLDEAARVLDGALVEAKKLGVDHPYLALVNERRAQVLLKEGRAKDAQPLLEQALAAFTKVLGEDNHFTKECASNLQLCSATAEGHP